MPFGEFLINRLDPGSTPGMPSIFIRGPFPLSSPRNLVGDLLFRKRTTTAKDRFPTTTLGNDKRKRLCIKQAVPLNLFQGPAED